MKDKLLVFIQTEFVYIASQNTAWIKWTPAWKKPERRMLCFQPVVKRKKNTIKRKKNCQFFSFLSDRIKCPFDCSCRYWNLKLNRIKIPDANGVEKSDAPADVVDPKDGTVLPNKDRVDAANKDDDDICGDTPDPNNEEGEAEVAGVANREDDIEEAGAEDGVLKRESPPPEEADITADVCGATNAPVAVFVSDPPTCADGCEFTGKCKVGCTLLAAASCLAVSRRSASRNGSLPSPRRRWSAR